MKSQPASHLKCLSAIITLMVAGFSFASDNLQLGAPGRADQIIDREEYRAGGAMPVGSRKAAPVCDDWPDTGWWLATNSNKRHNRNCENYRKTRGYPCKKSEGSPCGKCGG